MTKKMREYVQTAGVRPWHGDELVELQSEPFAALTGLFEKFGPFIVNGVEFSGTAPSFTISAGLVFIKHETDGWKVARFAGDVSTGDGLIYIKKTVTQKLYDDGNNHDAEYEYSCLYVNDDDPTYGTIDGALNSDQKLYLNSDVQNQRFDDALRGYQIPAFATEAAAIISTVQLSAATVKTRIIRSMGMVQVQGSVTVVNSNNFGLPAQWLGVKHLATLFSVIAPPSSPVYFTANVRYYNPNYLIENSNKDYIDVVGGSIDSDGILYIGAKRPIDPLASYDVFFNFSYPYA